MTTFDGNLWRSMGGEMELSAAQLRAMTAPSSSAPFLNGRTTTCGRTAIKLILQSLKTNGVRRALLPDYLCTSILQPFREEGYEIGFYRMKEDLSIDPNDLMRAMESVRPDVLVFINYFGFPVSPQAGEALNELKERCWIIEDCVHGSLIEQHEPAVGRIGHFAITSFRKYLPVPDGGLVINRSYLRLSELPAAEMESVQGRLLGKVMRAACLQSLEVMPELEETYLTLFASAEGAFDVETPMRAMSRVSTLLLGGIDMADVMERRRNNYSYLLKTFTEDAELQSLGTPLWKTLPPGVSPLLFPLLVAGDRRDVLRKHLAQLRVFCPIHWHLPAAVAEAEHPEAHALSRRILGLPIDQRYELWEIATLIARLRTARECMTSLQENLAA